MLFHKGRELKRLPALDDKGNVIDAKGQMRIDAIVNYFGLANFTIPPAPRKLRADDDSADVDVEDKKKI
jgi:hypothetical protein